MSSIRWRNSSAPSASNTIDATMIADQRQSRLTVSAIEQRLELMERLLLLPSFAAAPGDVNPKFGAPLDTINLFGNNFNLAPVSVFFGNTPAAIVGNPTASQIIAVVPNMAPVPAPGVKITVHTAGGSTTSGSGFVVFPPPAPAFLASPGQFNPKLGAAGTPNIFLFGTNFNVSPVSVLFGATPATITSIPNSGQIVVTVPAVPGSPINVPITVQTGGGTAVSVDRFAVS